MAFKRKRNIKIDNNIDYCVFTDDAFINDDIEDYEEVKSTGMEEDEEKEIHLQNIIKGTGRNIPLPVIIEIENPARLFYKPILVKKKINWQSDCPNNYIECESDKEELIKILGNDGWIERGAIRIINENSIEKINEDFENINDSSKKYDFRDAIKIYGEDSKSYGYVKNEFFVEFVLNRCLIRYEKIGYDAYVCFRDRVYFPKTKSRKNDQIIIDRLERMSCEFNQIIKMCDMGLQRENIEKELIDNKFKMILDFGSEFDNSTRKCLNVKKQIPVVDDAFYHRKKLKTFTSEFSKDLFVGGEFYDKYFSVVKKTADIKKVDRSLVLQEKSNTKKYIFENRFNCEIE